MLCNNCLVLCITVLSFKFLRATKDPRYVLCNHCIDRQEMRYQRNYSGCIAGTDDCSQTVVPLYGSCKPTQAPLSTVITLSFVCLSEQTNYSCFIKLQQCLRQCNRYSLLPRCTASVLISNNADVSTSV